MIPPIHMEREGIRSWRSREPTGELKDEQRRRTEEEDPEDVWTRSQDQEPWRPVAETRNAGPGEHTSEPATLQEKRGQTRYGISGQGERSGRREEKGKTRGTALRARERRGDG
ncbi:hypothetical protein NDU88_005506 [Pleurodeles waltl]|uniref:Uncharacterized protein n=1 Tax=Pleurodeles waltl TaxID=8319 RepID=A0AAV7NMP1_PLEWA|nr:hypothetical protein NDU88_005506 [Pleurodeles waltl]